MSFQIPPIEPVDPNRIEHYQNRLDRLTKPRKSLGRLEEIAARYAAIRHPRIELTRKTIFTFAADHGVAAEGVSLYPSEVTAQMVYNFLRGGAAINVLCRHYGIRNVVVDVGVNHDFDQAEGLVRRKIAPGTCSLIREPAMTRQQAEQALQVGLDLAAEHAGQGHIFGSGEMGIGNTTASSAIFSALTGLDANLVTGVGTGIGEQQRRRKADLVRRAVATRQADTSDPIDVLCKLGGFEIGAIAGLALGAASHRIPVVVDGFISTAGALLALRLAPHAGDYLFFSHCSFERGHATLLDHLGVRPLLDLELRLGEGTGAAIGIDLVSAAVKLMTEMATFEEAKVTKARERGARD